MAMAVWKNQTEDSFSGLLARFDGQMIGRMFDGRGTEQNKHYERAK